METRDALVALFGPVAVVFGALGFVGFITNMQVDEYHAPVNLGPTALQIISQADEEATRAGGYRWTGTQTQLSLNGYRYRDAGIYVSAGGGGTREVSRWVCVLGCSGQPPSSAPVVTIRTKFVNEALKSGHGPWSCFPPSNQDRLGNEVWAGPGHPIPTEGIVARVTGETTYHDIPAWRIKVHVSGFPPNYDPLTATVSMDTYRLLHVAYHGSLYTFSSLPRHFKPIVLPAKCRPRRA